MFDVPALEDIPEDLRSRIKEVADKSGFIPNIFLSLARRPAEWRAFFAYHDALMDKETPALSKGDRELIVVATSAENHCLYCVVAHGAIARIRARNPRIADQVATDWRRAELDDRQRAVLEVAVRIAVEPWTVNDEILGSLRAHGLTDDDIWDVGSISAFFAMSNRLAHLTSTMPNDEFYLLGRLPRTPSVLQVTIALLAWHGHHGSSEVHAGRFAVGDARSVVVVGAGLGGLSVCDALRQRGFDGPVTLLGDEPVAPYDRPPLSKQVIKGTLADPPQLRKPDELDALRLDLRLGTTAAGVDLAAREVRLAGGGRLEYDVLVIATGARPRHWAPAAGLRNVWTLRTDRDAAEVAAFVRRQGHLGVLGAGFIGCEVAASAREAGCQVTLLELLPVPLARVLGTAAGEEIARRHRAAGVDVRCGTAPEDAVAGGEGQIAGVRLPDGSVLALDALVVGLGVVPNVEWLEASGLVIDNGIACDAGGRTSAADVYAVGDVANWHDLPSGTRRRREHWTTTTSQAAVVAARITGHEEHTLDEVPYFWSDQYGIKIQCVGDADPAADITERLTGKTGDRPLYLYGRDGRLLAAAGFGLPVAVTRLRRLIADGAAVGDALALIDSLYPAVPAAQG
jgi:3-phenylpropionate/trans-cinnamate dioxygenase ferredoxin reductase subunit